MDTFKINCWARCRDDKLLLRMTVSKTEFVCELQMAIRQQISSGSFNTSDLALYKPKDPLPKKNLVNFIISQHAEFLDGFMTLSEVFPEPPPCDDRDVHIIVDGSSQITCWLRGTSLDASFPLTIQPGHGLEQFVPAIKDSQPHLRNIPNQYISVYKISGDENELRECLSKTGEGELLQGITLASNFLDLPVLDPLRVVIEVSSFTRSNNPLPFWHLGFGGADPIAAARDHFIQQRPQKKSPSDSSKPSAFRATQGVRATQIPCGRPRAAEELIPVTLLHPVFGQFEDDCHTGTMTDGDNQFVGMLADVLSDLHKDEDQRVNAVNEVFKLVHINLDLSAKIPGTNYSMDSSLSVGSDLPPYFIGEFKNELGSSTSEPYMQAISYYLEATKTSAAIRSKFGFPCLLLAVFGPYMLFAGAAWNLRPVVQILSTPIAFHYHSTDTRTQLTVARHMAAFRKALRTLKAYYEDLSNGRVKEHQSHDALFPYPTMFNSLEDGSTQTICYTKQHEEGGKKTRLVFFGILEGDPTVQICIKFTQCYSKDAHLHCAELGFAPKLRGFEVLPGGWHMIVMDNLVGYDLLANLPITERLPRSAFEDIKTQLMTLHDRKLVHGDIRDTNVFVNKDRTKLMIIDFDWAGVEDVVRYPPYVNFTDVERPKDARDGLPIKAIHDFEMLAFITEARATKNS